jgi:hypothetical protein
MKNCACLTASGKWKCFCSDPATKPVGALPWTIASTLKTGKDGECTCYCEAGSPVKVVPVEVPVVVVEEDMCEDPFPGCSKLKRDACKKCSKCQFMSACGCIPKQCACGDAKCIKSAEVSV